MNTFRVRKCPFCGGDAITGFDFVRRTRDNAIVVIYLYAGCPDCNIFKGKSVNIAELNFDYLSEYMEEVIKLWNERI